MDLNDLNALRALPKNEPIQLGGIKVATAQYDAVPNSLFVRIWDDFRMIEKEYDTRSGLLLNRQVSTQNLDVFGEHREEDQKMHKYTYISESTEDNPNTEIYKEYRDGELVTQEQRTLILDRYGKVIREEWQTIEYNKGIPSTPKYSTINHE